VRTLSPEERRAAQHLFDVLGSRQEGSFVLQATPLSHLLKSCLKKSQPSAVLDAFKRLAGWAPAQLPATVTTPQQLKLHPTRAQLVASTPAHAWGALDRPITLAGSRARSPAGKPISIDMIMRLGKMVNWGEVLRLEIDGYVMYLSEPFACGSFGSVSYGLDASGNMLAVKCISLEDMSMRAMAYKELQAMHRFGKALSPMRALELDGYLYVPMPLMQENAKRLLPAPDSLPAQRAAVALCILHDVPPICEAMHAQKEEAWSHGDIKPENILFDATGHAWLADFGLATPLENGINSTMVRSGTQLFMAPELHKSKASYAGEAADVWAFGMSLLSVATGQDLLSAALRNTPATGRQILEPRYAYAMRVFLGWRKAFVAGGELKAPEPEFTVLNQFMQTVSDTLGPGLFGLILHDMLAPDPTSRISFANLAGVFLEGRDYKSLEMPHGALWRSAARQHIDQLSQKTEPILGKIGRFLADKHGNLSPRRIPK
jgi:serine/threonine protein kinase